MPINLEHLERLEAEWRSLQPLQAALEERLWLKLRLEWNYHSNHIEGNTLTYKETELYLLRGQTSGVHVEREYTEMKGHDLAIEIVRNLAGKPEKLTEVDIRNLNQILLKQSFYKDAITPDGKPSRKEIIPGRYKIEPNSVLTSAGQLFKYADPMEVPGRMAKLVEIIRKSVDREGLEFLVALAVTHHEFTLIHPFDDGNGRVARLVTNYALLKKGLPPIVIPSSRKTDYLKSLGQADAGDPALLTDFFAEQLVWSLELGIKAAKGESLEEPSDVEKQITLFVREQKKYQESPRLKTKDDAQRIWEESLKPFLFTLSEKTKEIGELFSSKTISVSLDYGGVSFSLAEAISRVPAKLATTRGIQIYLKFNGYRPTSQRPFSIYEHLSVEFEDYAYELRGGLLFGTIIKPYSARLSSEEIDGIVSAILKGIFISIKRETVENTS